jgi:hypothetical protein
MSDTVGLEEMVFVPLGWVGAPMGGAPGGILLVVDGRFCLHKAYYERTAFPANRESARTGNPETLPVLR